MSYYPNNFYQNYQQQYNPIVNGIQGKSVESIDMVKINEIPFGSYGVFPKTDLSEIYIKTWNNNGTTKIMTYKPVEVPIEETVDGNKDILDRLFAIEKKLDELTNKPVSKPIDQKKKEAIVNGY